MGFVSPPIHPKIYSKKQKASEVAASMEKMHRLEVFEEVAFLCEPSGSAYRWMCFLGDHVFFYACPVESPLTLKG